MSDNQQTFTAAANHLAADLKMLEGAAQNVLALSEIAYLTPDEADTYNKATAQVLDLAAKIPVINSGVVLEDVLQRGKGEFVNALFDVLEKRRDHPEASFDAKVLDGLALWHLYQKTGDVAKAREAEEICKANYEFISDSPALRLVAYIQDSYASGHSVLDTTDLDIIDELLIKRTKKILAKGKVGEDVADQLAQLLEKIENVETYSDLCAQLYDYRSAAGKVQYIADLVHNARQDEPDETVNHPILRRFGATNGAVVVQADSHGIAEMIGVGSGQLPMPKP